MIVFFLVATATAQLYLMISLRRSISVILTLSILENVTSVFVENFAKKQAQKAAKLGKDKDRMERFQASIKGGGTTLIDPV